MLVFVFTSFKGFIGLEPVANGMATCKFFEGFVFANVSCTLS